MKEEPYNGKIFRLNKMERIFIQNVRTFKVC